MSAPQTTTSRTGLLHPIRRLLAIAAITFVVCVAVFGFGALQMIGASHPDTGPFVPGLYSKLELKIAQSPTGTYVQQPQMEMVFGPIKQIDSYCRAYGDSTTLWQIGQRSVSYDTFYAYISRHPTAKDQIKAVIVQPADQTQFPVAVVIGCE